MTLTAINRLAIEEVLRAMPKKKRREVVRRLASGFKRFSAREAKLREAVEAARSNGQP